MRRRHFNFQILKVPGGLVLDKKSPYRRFYYDSNYDQDYAGRQFFIIVQWFASDEFLAPIRL